MTLRLRLSARGRDSTNVVGGRIANTTAIKDYIFLTLTSLENKDTAFDLFNVIMYVIGWETRFCGLSQCLSTGALI